MVDVRYAMCMRLRVSVHFTKFMGLQFDAEIDKVILVEGQYSSNSLLYSIQLLWTFSNRFFLVLFCFPFSVGFLHFFISIGSG